MRVGAGRVRVELGAGAGRVQVEKLCLRVLSVEPKHINNQLKNCKTCGCTEIVYQHCA